MALATYSDLQTSVANFLHRGDLTSIIPDLITLAEVRINGDLDARLQDTQATLTCTPTVEYVALPTDLINIRHLSVESTTPVVTLDYMAPDTFETSYAWGLTGTPQAYTVIGTNIFLAPVPDTSYTLDCFYKAKVPAIASAVSGTTWLLTNYPNVYLYATLCEAAPYLKDDARLQVWEAKYNESVAAVNNQDWYSGSTMKVRADVTL